MPERRQLSRGKGFRLPPSAKSVARPGLWGNPFVVVRPTVVMLDWGPGIDDAWQVVRRDRTAGDGHYGRHRTHPDALTACIKLHRNWLTGARISNMGDTGAVLAVRLTELQGLDLACWCPLGSPCHADTLLELANPIPMAGREHHDITGDLR